MKILLAVLLSVVVNECGEKVPDAKPEVSHQKYLDELFPSINGYTILGKTCSQQGKGFNVECKASIKHGESVLTDRAACDYRGLGCTGLD